MILLVGKNTPFQDVPNFMDAPKDVHNTENVTAEAIATSNDIPEAEPDLNEGEAGQQSEYEVGIIENYYDAEDSTEEDTQVMKCIIVSGHYWAVLTKGLKYLIQKAV